MPTSWKITAFAKKSVVQNALLAHDKAWDWDDAIVLSGSEIDERKPQEWKLEAWLPRKPVTADTDAIEALFAEKAPKLTIEKLAKQDWLTLSQQGVEPIRAGRFYIHTPEYPASTEPGITSLCVGWTNSPSSVRGCVI